MLGTNTNDAACVPCDPASSVNPTFNADEGGTTPCQAVTVQGCARGEGFQAPPLGLLLHENEWILNKDGKSLKREPLILNGCYSFSTLSTTRIIEVQ